ncbi:MAG TPA: hypothetical protein VGH46_02640 [Gaiellaceae bacterium]
MRTKPILAAVLVAATALVLAGAASAGSHHQRHVPRGIRYTFVGQLTAAPNNGGVSINVVGGNRPALRAMLGAPVTQTFAYGASTEFLQWSKGVPAVVQPDQLSAGDYVRVNIRAQRGSSLATLEATDSALVGDHGSQLFKPSLKLYLFRGTIASVTDTSITVNVTGGNHAAVRLMLGQSSTQTFTTGGSTIFLLWQGKVPTVIASSQLKVGDTVVVRDRAIKNSTLAQVEANAARHVGEHEPANA